VSGHDLCYQSFGRFSNKVFRQIVGIPMGTKCAPLIVDLLYTIMNLYDYLTFHLSLYAKQA
jgi:hypothetical protein